MLAVPEEDCGFVIGEIRALENAEVSGSGPGKTAGETGDAADSQTQQLQLLPKGNRHRSDELVQGDRHGGWELVQGNTQGAWELVQGDRCGG